MTIKFLIQTDKNPANIYVRLKDGRVVDVKAKTGFVIDPENWNDKTGFPKTGTRNEKSKQECNSITAKLSDFEGKLKALYNETHNKLTIDGKWLQSFINPVVEVNEAPSTLVDYFTYYIKIRGADLKAASVTKLNVVKHLLERMEITTRTKYVIKHVDENFKLAFNQYSLNNGYAQNTIARNWTFIKTICYHASYNGVEVSPKLKILNMKKDKVEKIYLDLNDLKLIAKTKFTDKQLLNARDWLLISCDTGQRVSDFLRFTKDMIRYEGGKPLIEFTQVKTGKIMTVPLTKKVMEILTKRKGQFPKQISDQRYNEYIKTVCKDAGLTYKVKGGIINPETLRKESGTYEKWQLVTSHIGRRSFATNNYGTIPTALLIGATGHSSEVAFLAYIGKTDTQKAIQLAEYF